MQKPTSLTSTALQKLKKITTLLIVVPIKKIYFSCATSKVECNICHYKANRLNSNPWHLFTTCPGCGSDIRHRLLWATFERLDDFSLEKIIKKKDVLHFAPEKILGNLIKRVAKTYKTADFLTEGYYYSKIDFNIDISKMSDISDESFDCVIACDVLEHVPNYIGGIKEVHRVLRKGGNCIFTVPQKDNLAKTFEDLSVTDPAEREKLFGQFDHLRIYGDDFGSVVASCGFKVTVISENSFPKDRTGRNVLCPPVLSTRENATNFRKVFIGTK